jgi:hypothetical protein
MSLVTVNRPFTWLITVTAFYKYALSVCNIHQFLGLFCHYTDAPKIICNCEHLFWYAIYDGRLGRIAKPCTINNNIMNSFRFIVAIYTVSLRFYIAIMRFSLGFVHGYSLYLCHHILRIHILDYRETLK